MKLKHPTRAKLPADAFDQQLNDTDLRDIAAENRRMTNRFRIQCYPEDLQRTAAVNLKQYQTTLATRTLICGLVLTALTIGAIAGLLHLL